MGSRGDHFADLAKYKTPPRLEFLYESFIETGEVVEIGSIPAGRRFILPVLQGSHVDGPSIHGQILPQSRFTQLLRPDGVMETEGVVIIQMSDGPVVASYSYGLVWLTDEIAAALAQGAPYDPTAIHSEAFIRFEAARDEPYAWLNRGLYLGRSVRKGNCRYSTLWSIL